MSERQTIADMAQDLAVPTSTIKHWANTLPLGAEKDAGGRWRFDPRAAEVLRSVKAMRDQGRSYETIRRRLDPDEQPLSDRPAVAEEMPVRGSSTVEPSPDERRTVDQVVTMLKGELIAAVSEQTELAEKYARAAHQIGKLEAQLEAAESNRLQLAERVDELTPSARRAEQLEHQVAQLVEERDRHAREITEARSRITLLEAPQQRPWWRFW